MNRLSRAGRLIGVLAVGALVASGLFVEILRDLDATGFGDYQEYHHLWEAGRIAVERFGEWPLWNPYQCGGITQYGNPQTQVFHPLFFLSLIVGTTIGIKLFLLAHAALGFVGTYLVARTEERLAVVPSMLTAIGWVSSGYFAWHCGTGHANFIAFYLTPWLVLGWRRSARDVRWGAVVGVVMAAAVLAGGVYAFPFFVVLSAFEVGWGMRARHTRLRLLNAALLAILVTTLVAGVRLIPILADLQHHPRVEPSSDSMDVFDLLRALTWQDYRWPPRDSAEHRWQWVEYSAYLGWPLVALALSGAYLAARIPGRRRALAGAILLGLFTVGGFAWWAPWSLLHRLPIFDSLKVPSRFSVLFLFYFTSLAGLAAHEFGRAVRDRVAAWHPGRARAIALCATAAMATLAAADVAGEHLFILDGKWRDPPVRARSALPFFQATVPAPGELGEDIHPSPAFFPELNVGTGYCYSGMRYHGAAGLWRGWEAQARVEPRGGRVLEEGSTTNTVWALVEAPRAGRVVFNRTFSPGWVSSIGRVRQDELERMAVEVPAGVHRVELRYEPPTLPWALAASALGLLLVLLSSRPASRRLFTRAWSPALLAIATLAVLAIYFDRVSAAASSVPDEPRWRGGGASGYAESDINDWYRPSNARDGDVATEWHADEASPPWMELWSPDPRPVTWVRLLNARNAPFLDRASERVVVQAFLNDQLVATGRVDVARRWEGQESWSELFLDAAAADRLRIQILTHEGHGGGLAEVQVVSPPSSFEPGYRLRVSSHAESADALRDHDVETRWGPDEFDVDPAIRCSMLAPSDLGGVLLLTDAPPEALSAEVARARGVDDIVTGATRVSEGDELHWVRLSLLALSAREVRIHVPSGARVAEVRLY